MPEELLGVGIGDRLARHSHFSIDTRGMVLLRALNAIPLWTLILGLLAIFEFYSVGLMLLSRRKWD
jgi:hypothetical protein